GRYHIEERFHRSVTAPQRQQRTLDLLLKISLVVLEIDRSPSAIVLTHCVKSPRITEAAKVIFKRLIADRTRNKSSECPRPQYEFRVTRNEGLRQRRRLDKEEPVKVHACEFSRHRRVQLVRGYAIQHSKLCDRFGVIQRHTMANSASAIMPDHRKMIEPKLPHKL